MQSTQKAPIWQRIICGLVCIGGVIALPFNMAHSTYHGWHGAASIFLAVLGSYLFAHIALRGKLPGKIPGTKYVRFRHSSGGGNT